MKPSRRSFIQLFLVSPIIASVPSDLTAEMTALETFEQGIKNSLELGLFDSSGTEISVPGYSRVTTERSSKFWRVDGNRTTNLFSIQFPEITGGAVTISHIGVFLPDDMTSFASLFHLSNPLMFELNPRINLSAGVTVSLPRESLFFSYGDD